MMGKKVVLIDTDIGLRNLDVIMLSGERAIVSAILICTGCMSSATTNALGLPEAPAIMEDDPLVESAFRKSIEDHAIKDKDISNTGQFYKGNLRSGQADVITITSPIV